MTAPTILAFHDENRFISSKVSISCADFGDHPPRLIGSVEKREPTSTPDQDALLRKSRSNESMDHAAMNLIQWAIPRNAPN
jgi:hypothetical protein